MAPDPLPRVSVVLPTYDRAALLGRALRSVLEQSFGDLELIIVDDGSTDGTPGVLEAVRDRRVVLLRNERNQGYAAALNRGLRAARGELLALQDSDDEWLPGKLERQVAALDRAPEAGVVHTAFDRVGDGSRERMPPAWAATREGSVLGTLLCGNFIGASTVLFRRRCLDACGPFDERLPCLQDWEFWIRVATRSAFRFLDDPLVLVHASPGGVNDAGDAGVARALQGILDRHREELASVPRVLARHEHAIGHLLARSGSVAEGRAWLLRAARRDPARPKHALRAAVSLFGDRAYRSAQRLVSLLARAGSPRDPAARVEDGPAGR